MPRTVRVNQRVLDMEYAVRGPIPARAAEMAAAGREIIPCNIGNPQGLGQPPIAFYRQVLGLLENPGAIGRERALRPPDGHHRSGRGDARGVPDRRRRLHRECGLPVRPRGGGTVHRRERRCGGGVRMWRRPRLDPVDGRRLGGGRVRARGVDLRAEGRDPRSDSPVSALFGDGCPVRRGPGRLSPGRGGRVGAASFQSRAPSENGAGRGRRRQGDRRHQPRQSDGRHPRRRLDARGCGVCGRTRTGPDRR